ncbi:MAG: hypothetical protein HOW73_36400 [Polyangiaceae bacterium]|nr:hypothetical protein [Polyangiaceae bacterium]
MKIRPPARRSPTSLQNEPRARWLAALVLVGLHLSAPACSASVTTKTPNTAATRPVDTGPPFESPAHWVAFPQTVGVAQATLPLADGKCLVTTDDGQRWLVTPHDKSKPCVGSGVASGSPTFEPLVGAQRLGEEFRFIAEGGAVYTSREANGPFVRYVKAPTYLRRVAARGSSIVGLDDAGATYFYDGTAWKAAAVPKGARGIDVAADENGRVLWLGAPESALVSTDAGHTFRAPNAAPPRIGAHAAGFTKSGKLAARGALGGYVWEGDSLAPTTETISEVDVPDVEIEPTVGPRATMISEQRAALDGSRYYEITDASEAGRYSLAKASLGQPVEKVALEELEQCDNVKVAASAGILAFGCTKEVPDQSSLAGELYISKDGGSTLELKATVTTPSFSDMTFTLAQSGTMLVLGACKPASAEGEDEKPAEKDADKKAAADAKSTMCQPKGPLYVDGSTISAGTVPYLEEGSARSPMLSPDGRTAYFLGRNRKDSMSAVFVSRDRGHSYQMRTIEPPQSASWGDEEVVEDESGYVRPLYLTEGHPLTIDETGTLGVVGERDTGLAWITLDADGRIANVGEPPEPSFMIGGVGNRVLALGYGQMDGILRTWESLDGGVTWAEVTSTPAVQRYGERGGAFICAQGGCLLGDELARIGWEGQSEAPFTVAEDPFPAINDAKLSIPLSCQLVPKSEWVAIEGRPEERASASATSYNAYGSSPQFPQMREILRGKTLWSVASLADDGRVDITTAALPDKDGGAPSVTKKVLLAAAKSPKNGILATTVRAQAEGYVALRANVPLDKGGGLDTTKKLESFEVAWQNQYTGTLAKKSVSFDSTWIPSLYSGTTLRPSLLTVTIQGVTIQPVPGGKATYVDTQTSIPFDYPNLQAIVTDGKPVTGADATFLGGRPFAVLVADRSPTGQVVVTAPAAVAAKGKGPKADAAPAAMTVAPSLAEVDWMYTGERVGFVALATAQEGGEPPTATGFMIEPDGKLSAPIDLPTLADLADRPQPCSAEDRKTTPRTVSPHFGKWGALLFDQGRRAIMVADAAPSSASATFATTAMEPVWLLTDGAILHGTKKDPCLAAWRASGTRPGFVAIVGGNPEHSWLLRQTSGMKAPPKGGPSTGRWTQQLEARPMTCRYQPDLAVPYEVIARSHQRMSDDQPR